MALRSVFSFGLGSTVPPTVKSTSTGSLNYIVTSVELSWKQLRKSFRVCFQQEVVFVQRT